MWTQICSQVRSSLLKRASSSPEEDAFTQMNMFNSAIICTVAEPLEEPDATLITRTIVDLVEFPSRELPLRILSLRGELWERNAEVSRGCCSSHSSNGT